MPMDLGFLGIGIGDYYRRSSSNTSGIGCVGRVHNNIFFFFLVACFIKVLKSPFFLSDLVNLTNAGNFRPQNTGRSAELE